MKSISGEINIFKLMEKKKEEIIKELKKRYGGDIARLLKELS